MHTYEHRHTSSFPSLPHRKPLCFRQIKGELKLIDFELTLDSEDTDARSFIIETRKDMVQLRAEVGTALHCTTHAEVYGCVGGYRATPNWVGTCTTRRAREQAAVRTGRSKPS